MKNKNYISEKLNFCMGLSHGLTKLLICLLEVPTISNKDFNCILSLAEAIENNIEILCSEFQQKD